MALVPALHAAPASHSDARPSQPEQLIDLKEVCRRTGLGRTTIQKLITAKQFPPRVKITPAITRWSARQVEAWILERIAAAGR